jgi:hypothetical protein
MPEKLGEQKRSSLVGGSDNVNGLSNEWTQFVCGDEGLTVHSGMKGRDRGDEGVNHGIYSSRQAVCARMRVATRLRKRR